MGSNEISRVRWWQVVTTLPNRRVLSNRGQCIFKSYRGKSIAGSAPKLRP
jgi:hypothetical protein